MIGLTWEGIQERVPEHLRGAAHRLFDLGYEVNYRRQQPNRRRRKVPREVIDAENDDFTQLRIMIKWLSPQEPLLLLKGSVRDDEGEQLRLFDLNDMGEFWSFAESNGLCPCGKRLLTKRSARAIVGRARRTYASSGADRRDKVGMYPCSRWRDFFHVTSNPFPKALRSRSGQVRRGGRDAEVVGCPAGQGEGGHQDAVRQRESSMAERGAGGLYPA